MLSVTKYPHSRTGHVAPFETFCLGYPYLLSLGIVKTLGTGLQTPSRVGIYDQIINDIDVI